MTEGAGVAARAMLDRLVAQPAWAAIRLRDSATVTLVGGASAEVRAAGRRAARGGRPEQRPPVRPAARDAVPAGGRARVRGARRRHPAGRRRHRARGGGPARRRCSTALPDDADRVRRPRRLRDHRRGLRRPSSTGSSATRSATARAPTSSSAATTAPGCADWDADQALTVFRRLLEQERGAYWTFCFFTGDRFLIGACPERHVSVHGGDVRMNPISGTFRLRGSGRRPSARPGCWSSSPTRRRSTSSSWSSTRS